MASKCKLSDNELIDIIKKVYLEKGFPKIRDFKASNGLPSHSIYIKRFGSFANAIKLSGIPIPSNMNNLYGRKSYTRKELLDMFQKALNNKLKYDNRLITLKEIDTINELPSSSTYLREFGGIDNLYACIGISIKEYENLVMEDDMINKYKEIKEILNRTPNSRDLDRFSLNNSKYYSCSAYLNHFGSITNLQTMMGDKAIRYDASISKEERLGLLYKLYEELGYPPSQTDCDKCPYTPNSSWFRMDYGSYPNAIRELGLNPRSDKKLLITPLGAKTYSGYEYKLALVLEKYNIRHTKEERYDKYIPNFNKQYRFDFTIYEGDSPIFIEVFGIIGNKKYDEKTYEKIKLCKDNKLKLIEIYPNDLLGSFEEIYDKFLSIYKLN